MRPVDVAPGLEAHARARGRRRRAEPAVARQGRRQRREVAHRQEICCRAVTRQPGDHRGDGNEQWTASGSHVGSPPSRASRNTPAGSDSSVFPVFPRISLNYSRPRGRQMPAQVDTLLNGVPTSSVTRSSAECLLDSGGGRRYLVDGLHELVGKPCADTVPDSRGRRCAAGGSCGRPAASGGDHKSADPVGRRRRFDHHRGRRAAAAADGRHARFAAADFLRLRRRRHQGAAAHAEQRPADPPRSSRAASRQPAHHARGDRSRRAASPSRRAAAAAARHAVRAAAGG